MTTTGVEYYEIRVRGQLDCHWSTWFEGLTLTPLENGETLIAGPIQDQAALHGILAKIRDLGLHLLSVICKDDMMNQASTKTSLAARPVSLSREPILFSLLVIDFVLFASGAVAHMGIPIPLGFGIWNETFLVPAAIVEGVGALALGATLVSLLMGATSTRRLAWWALWYCCAGVLWGMGRLALGSIPAAHTVSNDFLHIAMTLVTTLALVRLASLRE